MLVVKTKMIVSAFLRVRNLGGSPGLSGVGFFMQR